MKRKKKRKPINRYTILIVITFIILSALVSRLVYLQVLHSDEYKQKAANNSYREIPEPAPRGNILDRNGVVLATNKQSYVLEYNETTESKKSFFKTMDKVFAILSQNGETQQDNFELKVPDAENPNYRFEFLTNDPATKKALEIRFKRDRGLNEAIEKQLFGNKTDKLTKAQVQEVNDKLLQITPEQTFKLLVKQYGIDNPDKPKYSVEQERKYMLIKDAVKMNSFSGYKPVIIASNIKKSTAFIFLQMLNELPGIDVTTQPMRVYPFGDLGSAFLGYVSKISSNQEKYAEEGYDVNSDYVGAAGIEKVYEDRLKGSKGGQIVRLNNYGRIVQELGSREPYPGQNIQLTIDKNVQWAAEKALDQAMSDLQSHPNMSIDTNTSNATRGAAVVIDVNTGAVIALVSKPGYDPNIFTSPGGIPSDLYNEYFNPDLKKFGENYVEKHDLAQYYNGKSIDQIVNILFPVDKTIKNNTTIRTDMYDIYPKPFYDYATQALIPPGSTFKPITAIAGLQEGVITANSLFDDQGIYRKNNYNGATLEWNQSHYTFGWVNLLQALEASINTYFYDVGDKLLYEHGDPLKGYDTLAKYAWEFGLGADPTSKSKVTTGIEIPENFGQVANLYSTKVRFSSEYYNSTVSAIKADRGIDIGVNDSDADAVKKTKTNIKNLIIQQMQSNTNNNAFTSKIIELLKQLIDEVPELKAKKISDNDISAAAQEIDRNVYNANGEIYTPANIYNAAIGQGMDQFTPVQMANYIATVVNGGTRYKVHLLDKITDADGNVISQVKPQVVEKVPIKQSTIDIIKQGMLAVTSGSEGTATASFQNFPIQTAGKTGSATYSTAQQIFGRTSYANYLGFAPYNKPQIAVFVSIFDGGYGSYAAPVARTIYEAYFKDEINKIDPGYTPYYDFMKPFFQQSAGTSSTGTNTSNTGSGTNDGSGSSVSTTTNPSN